MTPRCRCARRTRLAVLCGVLTLLAGCAAPPKPTPPEARAQTVRVTPPERADSDTAEDAADAVELPGEVKGRSWHIPWRVRDPKNPQGPPLPVLIADAKSGTMTDRDNPTLRLRDVRVKLFREGKHTADVQAAHMNANQRERVLVATGGVRVVSLTDPPDTVITADKITWDTRTDKLVAVGNAHLVSRPRDGGTPVEHSGGRITCDTALNCEIE